MPKWFIWEDLPIVVTRRGDWLHGIEPLHPRVAALFARHVVPSINGTYEIVIGRNRHPLVIDDTPFWVRSMAARQERGGSLGTVDLVISDGQQEALDPSTLMQASDHAFYCRIHRHGLLVPCRLKQDQYHTLAWSAETHQGRLGLVLAGQFWQIGAFNPLPVPAKESQGAQQLKVR